MDEQILKEAEEEAKQTKLICILITVGSVIAYSIFVIINNFG